jgi:hypothetical protein
MNPPIKRDDFYSDLAHESLQEACVYKHCWKMACIYHARKDLRTYYRDRMRDAALSAKRYAGMLSTRRVQEAV